MIFASLDAVGRLQRQRRVRSQQVIEHERRPQRVRRCDGAARAPPCRSALQWLPDLLATLREHLERAVVRVVDEDVLEGVPVRSDDRLVALAVEDDVLVGIVVEVREEVLRAALAAVVHDLAAPAAHLRRSVVRRRRIAEGLEHGVRDDDCLFGQAVATLPVAARRASASARANRVASLNASGG
ncbi:MAG: hypothetical protein HRU76_01325 [Phycisphaeraceae bacterium]|nr:MAG: hypothetical protein HRU76_01325 [Phycisphaeraceae bacterium]